MERFPVCRVMTFRGKINGTSPSFGVDPMATPCGRIPRRTGTGAWLSHDVDWSTCTTTLPLLPPNWILREESLQISLKGFELPAWDASRSRNSSNTRP
eukprot:scaffold152662_cov75-Attheya_sp.AAC.1